MLMFWDGDNKAYIEVPLCDWSDAELVKRALWLTDEDRVLHPGFVAAAISQLRAIFGELDRRHGWILR